MKHLLLSVVIFIFFAFTTELAVAEISGNDLLLKCRQGSSTSAADVVAAADAMYCAGYIVGSLDQLEDFQNRGGVHRICIPQKVTVGQEVDIIRNYLLSHPEIRQAMASRLIDVAFLAAFPCPHG